jgi:hypothetical protein
VIEGGLKLPARLQLDPTSFIFGLVVATVLWWVLVRSRPLWHDVQERLQKRQKTARERRVSMVEAEYRRWILRKAQAMHLASTLFALDEVLEEPLLLAPPPRVEPGGPVATEDAISLTLPYLPAWPQLGAAYGAQTLSLADALSAGCNIVVIGQPGDGKTVALAHLASLAANRDEALGTLRFAVPFLMHVAELNLPLSGQKAILDRLVQLTAEGLSEIDERRIAAFVERSLKSGQALFLLDGFDELTAEAQNAATDFLHQFLRLYPKVHIATTGAPEYLDGLLALGFVPLAVAAWSSRRQAHFVRAWVDLWSESVAHESWAQGRPEAVDPILLGSWLSNNNENLSPLEFTLKMWAACAGDGSGPRALDDIAAHIRRLAPADTPMAALETLAMEVILTAQPVFDPRQARGWVRSFELPEEAEIHEESAANDSNASGEGDDQSTPSLRRATVPRAPTRGLLGRLSNTGLVTELPGNRMRFLHPVIGGYLAGRALSGYKAEETLLNQPDWIGKLLAMRYFAAHADASSLVDTMLRWSRLPTHRPMLTAARWLRDAPNSASWRSHLFQRLASLLQTSGLPLSLRGQALAALVCSNDPAVATLLRQLLGALSFEEAHLAALGIGAVRDEKGVAALETLMQSGQVLARRAACLALVSIGTTKALEAVGQALLSADEELRRAAAEALANDPLEGCAMLKDGASMSDIPLRRATAYGLGRISETWATELLEKMRVEDDQWVVRNAATEMLEQQNRADDPRIPRPLKPPSESQWLIAFAGTRGVGISPGAPATDILLAALKSTIEEERLGALEYLKQRPSDGVIRDLYAAMFGNDLALREAAFIGIWEIGAGGYKLPDPIQFGRG